jgi:hypothetical protein
MSPSAVRHAVQPGKQRNRVEQEAAATATAAIPAMLPGKCSPQNALNVAKTLRCRLNRVRVDRSIAAIVIAR